MSQVNMPNQYQEAMQYAHDEEDKENNAKDLPSLNQTMDTKGARNLEKLKK